MKNRKKILTDIIIAILIVIAISANILPRIPNNLDELWNFNFAKNVSDNRIPYKDFNMVTTPLLPLICGIILKLTAKELIITRILAILLNSAIIFMVYKILETCKINKYLNYLVLIIMHRLYRQIFCLDYNFTVLLIILVLIYMEIKKTDKEKKLLFYDFKYDLKVGIIAGTAILFKQSVGLAVAVMSAVYKIILVENKQDFKKAIKIILARILGIIIPSVIFIVYLIATNSYYDFLDYAVYGIKTFDNVINYTYLIKNYGLKIKVLSVILPITMIYTYFASVVKEKKDERDLIKTCICVYSVASFTVVFPISDSMHFLVGSMPAMILLVFSIYDLHKIKTKKIKEFIIEFLKIFTILTAIYLTILNIRTLYLYVSKCPNYNKVNHFKYIPATENMDNTVSDYIISMEKEGIKVYILDPEACSHTIKIDRYNKNYDMFLKGALGSKGEEGQIENLNQEENIRVLILKEKYRLNWQAPKQVIKYIKNNWKKVGEIYIFDIYEK